MNSTMLPVEIMQVGYVVFPLIVLYIALSFVKNQVVKCAIYFLKAFAYLGLAYFMWKFYSGKEQIDILSAFTFIFCCFESADNFISLISVPIEWFREIKGMGKFKNDNWG